MDTIESAPWKKKEQEKETIKEIERLREAIRQKIAKPTSKLTNEGRTRLVELAISLRKQNPTPKQIPLEFRLRQLFCCGIDDPKISQLLKDKEIMGRLFGAIFSNHCKLDFSFLLIF